MELPNTNRAEQAPWRQVSLYHFVVASCFTSLTEASLLYPFDVIKTREQVNPTVGHRHYISNRRHRSGTGASGGWLQTFGSGPVLVGSTRSVTASEPY